MSARINIYDLLDDLEKRKGLYLGSHHRNFASLDSFIQGFSLSATRAQMEHKAFPSFYLFSIWVVGHIEKHFGEAGGWHWQIRNRYPSNDEKAFKEFFILLRKFKRSKIAKETMLLDKASRDHYKKHVKRRVHDKWVSMKKPETLERVTFSNSSTTTINYINSNGKVIGSSWRVTKSKINSDLLREFGRFENKWMKVKV